MHTLVCLKTKALKFCPGLGKPHRETLGAAKSVRAGSFTTQLHRRRQGSAGPLLAAMPDAALVGQGAKTPKAPLSERGRGWGVSILRNPPLLYCSERVGKPFRAPGVWRVLPARSGPSDQRLRCTARPWRPNKDLNRAVRGIRPSLL